MTREHPVLPALTTEKGLHVGLTVAGEVALVLVVTLAVVAVVAWAVWGTGAGVAAVVLTAGAAIAALRLRAARLRLEQGRP